MVGKNYLNRNFHTKVLWENYIENQIKINVDNYKLIVGVVKELPDFKKDIFLSKNIDNIDGKIGRK